MKITLTELNRIIKNVIKEETLRPLSRPIINEQAPSYDTTRWKQLAGIKILKEELNVETLASGGKYIGIQITSGAEQLLELPEVQEKIQLGWQPLIKHISIVPPPFIGGLIELLKTQTLRPKDLKTKWAELGAERANEFAEKIKELYGKTLEIQAVEIGISPDAMAVKVKIDEFDSFPPLNAFRHLTVAIPVGGKAMSSNNIQAWEPLEKSVMLSGILLEL